MPGITDYEFQQPESPHTPPPRPSRALPITVAIAVLAIAVIGAYVWFNRGAATEAPQQEAAAPAPVPEAPVATDDTPQYDLPPLEDSDEFMRERMGELTSHPLMAAWMKGTDLIRNLAVVLENTSRGLTPSIHLRALQPRGEFRVVERGDRLLIDVANYERFDGIAAAAATIDPAAAGRLYRGIKPLLQMAYDQLGSQEPVDVALGRAISGLMRAPIVEGNIPVEIGGEGVGYRFADPKLESLSPAQKQLIRMGPSNQQTIQDQLLRFAAAARLTVQ
ncbi:MAG: DUF3014 domain-containing protein [Vicinamibacterales bacterium]